jgi:hypothetical protein
MHPNRSFLLADSGFFSELFTHVGQREHTLIHRRTAQKDCGQFDQIDPKEMILPLAAFTIVPVESIRWS